MMIQFKERERERETKGETNVYMVFSVGYFLNESMVAVDPDFLYSSWLSS